jgi:hypothetical protein
MRLTLPHNISGAKIGRRIFRLDFFGSRKHLPHLLSSKGQNYQRGVLPISAGAIVGHSEGKMPRKVHQGCLVLTQQCPVSQGVSNREETNLPGLPISWSHTLFSRYGPVGPPPVPWTEKTIEMSPVFFRNGGQCWRGDLIRRTKFWFFLSGLKKLEQRVKTCFELHGEYVE